MPREQGTTIEDYYRWLLAADGTTKTHDSYHAVMRAQDRRQLRHASRRSPMCGPCWNGDHTHCHGTTETVHGTFVCQCCASPDRCKGCPRCKEGAYSVGVPSTAVEV